MKNPLNSSPIWISIILGVIAWHVFWWMVVSPARPALLSSGRSSVVKLVNLEPAGDGSNLPALRKTWLPSMISLPSVAGFSRTVMQDQDRHSPPLDWHQDLSVQYAASTALASAESGKVSVAPNYDPGDRLNRPASPEVLPTAIWRISKKTSGWTAAALQGFSGDPLPPLPLSGLPKPTETEGRLVVEFETNDRGRILSAFARESSFASGITGEIMRKLYLWKIDSLPAGSVAVLRLDYAGKVASPAEGASP